GSGRVGGGRSKPGRWERGISMPGRTCWEEWTDAGNHQRPPPPHPDAPAGGRKDTRGEDQDQLCWFGLRGLGSVAMRVAPRGAILVRPAYLAASDLPPVRPGPASAGIFAWLAARGLGAGWQGVRPTWGRAAAGYASSDHDRGCGQIVVRR